MAIDGALRRRVAGLLAQALNGTAGVTEERVEGLAELIGEPSLYTQRFVEQLSFVETGGQRWIRTLQVEIPVHSAPLGRSWRIVPLGQFKRRRRADLVVKDAAGSRLNLLTRNQHVDASAKAVATRHTPKLTKKQLKKEDVPASVRTLHALIYEYFSILDFSNSQGLDDRSKLIAAIGQQYETVLTNLGNHLSDHQVSTDQLAREFIETANTTQYLCWVTASPGETVNLEVVYTAHDPKHQLNTGSLWNLCVSVAQGVFGAWKDRARERRADWYRQYGLAPIDYDFDVPRGDLAPGSYYFTLEPPENTICSYLDWEADSSFNKDHEVDSALPSAHLHESSIKSTRWHASREPQSSGKLRAYLRCRPHHHKQILGATALNIAVVWLLARGRLSLGGSLQGLIVAAPSVLLAFLVQQQRHYYAHVMRRQRLILWGYLAISVAFVVLVPVGGLDEHTGRGLLHDSAVLSAQTLAIASAGIFMWHWPLGSSYERGVKYFADRKWEMVDPTTDQESKESVKRHRRFLNWLRGWWWQEHKAIKWKKKPTTTRWECFAAAVRFYCNSICLLAIAAMLGSTFALREYADFSTDPPHTKPNYHSVLTRAPSPLTPTNTSSPSW